MRDPISVMLEPMILAKGSRFSHRSTDFVTLDYLQIPALFKVGWPAGRHGLYVMSGPTVGILLRAKATTYSGEEQAWFGEWFFDTPPHRVDGFRRFDWGVALGGGVSLWQDTKRSLVVEARYDLGLSDIHESKDFYARTRQLLITVGFTTRLGAK